MGFHVLLDHVVCDVIARRRRNSARRADVRTDKTGYVAAIRGYGNLRPA